jgi:hypothetical protein
MTDNDTLRTILDDLSRPEAQEAIQGLLSLDLAKCNKAQLALAVWRFQAEAGPALTKLLELVTLPA